MAVVRTIKRKSLPWPRCFGLLKVLQKRHTFRHILMGEDKDKKE